MSKIDPRKIGNHVGYPNFYLYFDGNIATQLRTCREELSRDAAVFLCNYSKGLDLNTSSSDLVMTQQRVNTYQDRNEILDILNAVLSYAADICISYLLPKQEKIFRIEFSDRPAYFDTHIIGLPNRIMAHTVGISIFCGIVRAVHSRVMSLCYIHNNAGRIPCDDIISYLTSENSFLEYLEFIYRAINQWSGNTQSFYKNANLKRASELLQKFELKNSISSNIYGSSGFVYNGTPISGFHTWIQVVG